MLPQWRALALWLLSLALCIRSAEAQSPEELFEKVFGARRASAATIVPAELMLDGREAGLVNVMLAGDGSFQVDTTTLLEALSEVLSAEACAALQSLASEHQNVAATDLVTLGVTLEYDPATLRLVAELHPDIRRLAAISIRNGSAGRRQRQPDAAAFSFYTNIHGSSRFVHASPFEPSGLASTYIALDSATRLRAWLLEAEAQYQSGGVSRWRRGDVRLVRDNIDSGVRFIAGDLHWQTQPLIGGHRLAGISLARNFDIQPYRQYQPSGQQDFLITSPSTVDIYVNGLLRRSVALGPGKYSVNDLPIAYGVNDYQLRIVDRFGDETLIDGQVYSASRLLAKGISEFGLTAGVRATQGAHGIDYASDEPVLAGYWRAGMTDALTLGFAGHLTRDTRLLSSHGVLATAAGNFTSTFAAGQRAGDSTGFAVELGYRHFQDLAGQQGTRTWELSAYGLSAAYNGALSGSDASSLRSISMRVAQPVSPRSSFSLAAHVRRRGDSEKDLSASASFSYRWPSGLGLRFAYYRLRQDGNDEDAFSLGYTLGFGDGKDHVQGDYDSRTQRRSTTWQRAASETGTGIASSLGYIEEPGNRYLDGALNISGARFEADWQYNHADNLQDPRGALQSSRLSFATAFAFAGGHAALTRHITDSFAIAVPHENYEKFRIRLKTRNSGRESASGAFGSAIVSGLTAYETRELETGVDALPLGYDMQDNNPAVTPRYRSGVVITVGNAASVILRAQLHDDAGLPLSLRSGVVRFLDDEAEETKRFFTNRKGKVTLSGIRPGKYEIQLDDAPISHRIEIPANASGVLNIGVIRL